MDGKWVAYYRVSTKRQGRSGLGLDAQREAVMAFLNGGRWKLLAEYTETESGKRDRDERPQLDEALRRCEVSGARLIIAKLDRLSRNAEFLLKLRNSGVRFVAADMPEADDTMVGIMALFAQREREMISRRTKEALAAAKRRGVRLGNPLGVAAFKGRQRKGARIAAAARAKRADDYARQVGQDLIELRAQGVTSLEGLASGLNAKETRAPRGGQWHASSVRNLLARLERLEVPTQPHATSPRATQPARGAR